MTTPSKVVAVTGSSGHMGAKLLEHLEETPGLGKLVAFDTGPLRFPIHNIAAYRRDVSEPIDRELSNHNVTTLAHFAFAWKNGLRRREALELSERNRLMLKKTIDSCRRASVGHIIYLSSHSVYGARPGAVVPISEDWPCRPSPGFPYAQDNYAAENTLLEFAEQNPQIKVTIFRSCPALGTLTSVRLLREMYSPGWVGGSESNPPLQFVNDDDLARILCLAISNEPGGIYNVAGDGVVFLRELAGALPARRVLLPGSVAYPLKRITGGAVVAYGHNLDRWPIIMSTSRLRQTTHYRFRHTATDAVSSFANYNDEMQQTILRTSGVR